MVMMIVHRKDVEDFSLQMNFDIEFLILNKSMVRKIMVIMHEDVETSSRAKKSMK
jgi:hypothetical protein